MKPAANEKSRAQIGDLRVRLSNSRSCGAAVETSGPSIRNYIGNDMNFMLDFLIRVYYNLGRGISKIDVFNRCDQLH